MHSEEVGCSIDLNKHYGKVDSSGDLSQQGVCLNFQMLLALNEKPTQPPSWIGSTLS